MGFLEALFWTILVVGAFMLPGIVEDGRCWRGVHHRYRVHHRNHR